MGERRFEVGICGTFDVANYGDLLFPLIAESELTQRLGAVTLHRFSYHAKSPPEWPYEVASVTALPQTIHRLDGLLIGGGFIIRFDKHVAPGYAPPVAEIHHPTGYWLMPALIALQHDVPLMWNAPGMHDNDIPTWADALMTQVLKLSRYVAVRDEPTRSALEHLSGVSIDVVPDTGFGIARLLDLEGAPSAEFKRVCEASGLDGPYIVVQATLGLEGFVRFVRKGSGRLRDFRFLALPIGPVLGEHAGIIDADLPGVVRLAEWPNPLVIAELIGRSEAVVGHSYHLFITALAFGVPVFTRQNLSTGKYCALQQFDSIFMLPPGGEPDSGWFVSRVGRRAPCASARATYAPLARHWDRIAATLCAEPVQTAAPLNRFWQTLPSSLEHATAEARERLDDALKQLEATGQKVAEQQERLEEAAKQLEATGQKVAEQQVRLEDAAKQLAAARRHAAALERRIAEIMASTSWRITAPMRLVGRQLRRNGSGE